MVELRNISKYFPSNGVMALENASLTLRPGEIHALLGENGTGKSTLMHILAGYFQQSSGSVFVDSRERSFSSPAAALALGIGMVRQHPGFIRGFKVWEDCILGAERPACRTNGDKWRNLLFNPGKARKRLEELSRRWNFDLPLDDRAESLTVSQRQKSAVLSLLLRDVRYFIFDEPTAVLTKGETQSLFGLLNFLRDDGRGIIFITHKLDEALAVSGRVTIIRRGATLENRDTKDLSIEELQRQIGACHLSEYLPKGACHPFEPVLSIRDLTISPPGLPHVENINLKLTGGMIMGIAGVRDAGLETLELALTGFLSCSGSIALNGHEIAGKGVLAFRNAGGAYLGADRLGNNLITALPLIESLMIHAHRKARRGIFLDIKRVNDYCRDIMKRAGIARSVSDRASSFSGGMLQRILLAREFAENPSLLVLAEATSGLDEANRFILLKELREYTRQGGAALLFSSDTEELISLADEVLMLRNGVLTAIDKPVGGSNDI
ncbi:MAG: ATP-binding cassette domain-containing protein [Treponema sp.]|jgi:simple sugar transport system ATP-binding protein|nr:ATP-binding cassette domain-containing protein [Treponema sp.]